MATSTIKAENLESYSVTTACIAYRRGHIVTVVFNNVTPASTSQRTNIGTLPVGWRPPGVVYGYNANGTGYGDVLTNGVVQVFGGSNKTNIAGYVTYVVGS